MKPSILHFGFLSGLATSVCYLPMAILLTLVIIYDWNPPTTPWVFTPLLVGVKFFVEKAFWYRMFPLIMDNNYVESWRTLISRRTLLSEPLTNRAMVDMFADLLCDAWLIFVTFSCSTPPFWVFLVYAGAQTLAAPIQGLIADVWSRLNYRKVSMAIIGLAICASFYIRQLPVPATSHLGLEGGHLTTPTLALILLGFKCALSAINVIARALVADHILNETEKKLGWLKK